MDNKRTLNIYFNDNVVWGETELNGKYTLKDIAIFIERLDNPNTELTDIHTEETRLAKDIVKIEIL